MLKIRLLTVAAAVAASVTAASGAFATPVATVQPRHAQARFITQLHYTFDRGETLNDGSIVTNVGHPHFPARVSTAFSGHLTVVPGRIGHGAGFPRQCATCGRGIIQASDRPGLDPGTHAVSFGLSVKATSVQAQGSSNLLQKGPFDQVGGQYKLQMNNGMPSCVIFGSRGRLLVQSNASIANGAWHGVSCSRIMGRVTLRVDGHIVARLHGPTGVISNTAPVRVGGLALIKANEQYHGNLDGVFIRIKS